MFARWTRPISAAIGEVRAGSVDLVVTSPPYLQVVNYGTANWIRLWLLGVDEVGRERGAGRKKLNGELDHRHNYTVVPASSCCARSRACSAY